MHVDIFLKEYLSEHFVTYLCCTGTDDAWVPDDEAVGIPAEATLTNGFVKSNYSNANGLVFIMACNSYKRRHAKGSHYAIKDRNLSGLLAGGLERIFKP